MTVLSDFDYIFQVFFVRFVICRLMHLVVAARRCVTRECLVHGHRLNLIQVPHFLVVLLLNLGDLFEVLNAAALRRQWRLLLVDWKLLVGLAIVCRQRRGIVTQVHLIVLEIWKIGTIVFLVALSRFVQLHINLVDLNVTPNF